MSNPEIRDELRSGCDYAFVHGFVPALTIGAITVALGAAAALLIPPLQRATATR